MSAPVTNAPPQLRLWPGVAIVALQWILRYLVPLVYPDALYVGVFGGLILSVGVLVWWVFFSRAPKWERWGALLLIPALMAATRPFLDPSIATGMMGFLLPIYAVPVLSLALVAWAAATRNWTGARRWVSMPIVLAIACAGFTLLRTDGMTGGASSAFMWRWTKTAEQKLLAQAALPAEPPPPAPSQVQPPTVQDAPSPAAASPAAALPVRDTAEWPEFRGRGRAGVVAGVAIETDWSSTKPVELWRKPIGPGWSSFAVDGDRLFTQEQRGDEEVVACYDAATGQPVWAHRDAARFWESNAGAGPRGTPTLHAGRVYALGATGILNALEAASGRRVWSRNAAADTKEKLPGWGFSSSPLIVGDRVVVALSGRVAAYDLASGNLLWLGPEARDSYSSPHLFESAAGAQILMTTAEGAVALSPADGKVVWRHRWEAGVPIVQPAVLGPGGLLLSGGDGNGMRRLQVEPSSGGGWNIAEKWVTLGLKPYFNDYAVHDGHAYGFDGSILACIDLEDGKRKWKGGRYGHGQLILLRDQGVLVVLSEEGELALVKAESDKHTELARIPAIEGKTWNHPVLAGGRLFVRNGSEMAAFRLPLFKNQSGTRPSQVLAAQARR